MTDNQFILGGAPYVVSEKGIQGWLDEGWRLEVVCAVAPEEKHSNIFGQWLIRVASPDAGSVPDPSLFRYLNTVRNNLEPRRFKTVNGLVLYLTGMGVVGPRVPMHVGEVFQQDLKK